MYDVKFSISYFIEKYEKTKEDDWCMLQLYFNGGFCAFGLCGVTVHQGIYQFTPEAVGLIKIFGGNHLTVTEINDNLDDDYRQETPRQRILAALYDKLAEANVIEASKLVNQENVEA